MRYVNQKALTRKLVRAFLLGYKGIRTCDFMGIMVLCKCDE